MAPNQKIYESQLYEVWKKQKYINNLKTVSGDDVEILDVGAQDLNCSGPDFKNARVRIGNLTYVGDIEIDSDYRDWKLHGHNIDGKYNRVILHTSLFNKFNQPYVYTKDGRKVPTLCLNEYIDENILQKYAHKPSQNDEGASLKCSINMEVIPAEVKEKFLCELGVTRFKKKCTKIHHRVKEIAYLKELKIAEPVFSYDLPSGFEERVFENKQFEDKEIWEQVFYELVFEALGYTKNKSIMRKIAQSAHISFIKSLKEDSGFILRIEAALLGISGLLKGNISNNGDKAKAYIAKINSEWEKIKNIYDGRTYEEADLHFFKLRPQNFPTLRLAAGARLLKEIIDHNLIGKLVKKITEVRNLTVLINSLRSMFIIRSDGFWAHHYVFDKESEDNIKYFIGANRADEIVINVILPFFVVYFEIFGNEKLSKKLCNVFSIYNQKSNNKIVSDIAEALNIANMVKRSVLSQGMIELFRGYCSKGKCLECKLGKIIFS